MCKYYVCMWIVGYMRLNPIIISCFVDYFTGCMYVYVCMYV